MLEVKIFFYGFFALMAFYVIIDLMGYKQEKFDFIELGVKVADVGVSHVAHVWKETK